MEAYALGGFAKGSVDGHAPELRCGMSRPPRDAPTISPVSKRGRRAPADRPVTCGMLVGRPRCPSKFTSDLVVFIVGMGSSQHQLLAEHPRGRGGVGKTAKWRIGR